MTHKFKTILSIAALSLFVISTTGWAQNDADSDDKSDKKEKAKESAIYNEASFGVYYLDRDSYRYGKYSGLTDKGWYALLDFRIEKRPVWDSGDTVRWRLQGWRIGLDSRRLEFDYNQQGKQKLNFDYREIPNTRFTDGLTPYRAQSAGTWRLAPEWEVRPGSSNTRGFSTLEESLVNLTVDTKRRRMDLDYDRKLGQKWVLDIDLRHETKEGNRTLASIFGFSGGNPRAVILPAPVDWTTDIVEVMFRYSTSRIQAGAGVYASFFSNHESTLTFQNAYGRQSAWDESVRYPDAQGRIDLAPDNSYIQFKAYGGMNFAARTRLTADFSYGKMEQDDNLLPWSINDNLVVNTPVPLSTLDGEVNVTMLNLRLTSQFARSLGLRVNYHYDDRDNKTPREVYPYIGGDSEDQKAFEDGRVNLPYSYTRHKADAILTWRFVRSSRLRAGVEYQDYSRDYQEVSDSDELTWLAGLSMRGWDKGSLNFDYRNSTREVSEYTGNAPLIASSVPGTVEPDDYENHPLLRKYFLTDRDRQELRLRADYFPNTVLNVGFAAMLAEDDYNDQYFGLNEAEIESYTFDFGLFPAKKVALTGFYTLEKYEASQSARSWFTPDTAVDPRNDWFTDIEDEVDTWNLAINFTDIGGDDGGFRLDLGADYTYSDVRSNYIVTAPELTTGPLPELVTKMQTFSLWASIPTGDSSSIRLTAERSELSSDDWGLDNVVPDSLNNVLLLGESAANYDLWLLYGSWTLRF